VPDWRWKVSLIPIYFERLLFREIIIALGLIAGWVAISIIWGVGALFPLTPFSAFLIILLVAIIATFWRLTIRISPESIAVGYGRITRQIPWENVESCYLDETSAIYYGGFGIRFARIRGKWRMVYNIIGTPRVVLSLKAGRFREFVFSTKNPEEVLRIINDRIGAG
jgi:hypothetical protein